MAQYLSIRESEILQLVASGRSTKEIAADLAISESTVNWHVSNVLAKLGASTRAEAVALFMSAEPPSAHVAEPVPTAIDVTPRATRRWRLRSIALAGALLLVLIGGAPLVGARHDEGTAEPATPTTSPTPTATVEASATASATSGTTGRMGPPSAGHASSAPNATGVPAPTIAPPTLALPALTVTPSALPIPTLPPVPSLPRLGLP